MRMIAFSFARLRGAFPSSWYKFKDKPPKMRRGNKYCYSVLLFENAIYKDRDDLLALSLSMI